MMLCVGDRLNVSLVLKYHSPSRYSKYHPIRCWWRFQSEQRITASSCYHATYYSVVTMKCQCIKRVVQRLKMSYFVLHKWTKNNIRVWNDMKGGEMVTRLVFGWMIPLKLLHWFDQMELGLQATSYHENWPKVPSYFCRTQTKQRFPILPHRDKCFFKAPGPCIWFSCPLWSSGWVVLLLQDWW